ncbi:MAG: cupin domain-containing protein [Porticoccaceae bacterium]|jgi:uncharacterized cupin superfamily protein|nr:cupin domain-containing protein [Porticoccaceae bacterium]MDE0876981.1 cupin domain-containing protein [Porticoccaceae bacterium]
MKKLCLFGVFFMATLGMPAQSETVVLSLNKEIMKSAELESIPPWPTGVVLSGANEHWQKVVHQGDFVVALYESMPALIDVSDPFPYDEFVTVLEGEVILTSLSGEKQAYAVGDSFLVPKGWQGTWDMPVKFREMIVIETKAWVSDEE